MDVHRLGPDKPLNNTASEYFRDQGVKIVIFCHSVVRIMGKGSDDSSISFLLLSGHLKK